jgi:ketosteroid isomerase-like protein
MPTHRAVVETYLDGFRRSDHAQILGCLTDDVVWDLPGYRHLIGKDAFDGEIENEQSDGPPTLTVDRLVEQGDTVVVIGDGQGMLKTGDAFRFAFCTVFTFAGELIGRVESYIVPLTTGVERASRPSMR